MAFLGHRGCSSRIRGVGDSIIEGFLVDLVIRIWGLPLSKYIYFTFLGNVVWLHIVDVVVSAPILH